MKAINEIYQKHVEHELKLVNNQHNLLNKERVQDKVLSFLCELGKVGEEAQIFSFWDESKINEDELMDCFISGLSLLMSIGFELNIDSIKNYPEITNQTTPSNQLVRVYQEALKINETYSFEDFQNCLDDYLTLAFTVNLDFDAILQNYANSK